MSTVRKLAWLSLSLPLSACATNPIPVSSIPGPNKDAATYQKDETVCRTEAARAAYPTSASRPAPQSGNVNTVWQTFFTTYGNCESAHGNLVQPVPWGLAYQLYLGYGLPYAYGYPPAYGYP